MHTGLLVEDHPDARVWLTDVVHAAFPGIVLSSAGDLESARQRVEDLCAAGHGPDIAVVDLGLPDGPGETFIAELRVRVPSCMCVVASRYTDDDHLFAALRAGASGYLLKQRPKAELTRLLRGIASGEPPIAPALVKRLIGSFHADTPDQPNPLTPREREVLGLLAEGLTLTKIGTLLGITRHTVAAHVKRIYLKLEISSRAEATLQAVRMGVVSA